MKLSDVFNANYFNDTYIRSINKMDYYRPALKTIFGVNCAVEQQTVFKAGLLFTNNVVSNNICKLDLYGNVLGYVETDSLTSGGGYDNLVTLNNNYLYVGKRQTDGNASSNKVYKIDPETMELLASFNNFDGSSENYHGLRCIHYYNDILYCGEFTSNGGIIYKLDASDLSLIESSSRDHAVMSISSDENYLYESGYEVIKKVDPDNLNIIETCTCPEEGITPILNYSDYIFASPNRDVEWGDVSKFYKIDKSNMSIISEYTLHNNLVSKLTADSTYIYSGEGSTNGSEIHKIKISDLSFIDKYVYGDNVKGISLIDNKLFVSGINGIHEINTDNMVGNKIIDGRYKGLVYIRG